ncbi:MAG: hypothetical protein ACIAXF_12000 [Phycisphaerales bacterium JB063]
MDWRYPLAQTAKPSEISEHFKHSRWDLPWELLVIGLGILLIVVTIISGVRWWQSRYTNPSALVLFSALARKAGLGWADRFLLWRIARSRGLSSPIALLIARGALEQHSQAYRAKLSGFTAARVGRRIDHIAAQLFGSAG